MEPVVRLRHRVAADPNVSMIARLVSK
jgi:hypothetical protein